MRVVAGSARGRRLVAPDGRDVRPTLDRVRESVFNSLGSIGVTQDAAVLDLFAGSGALGIEALSRGSASATFVDDARPALVAVRANLVATGLAASAVVVAGDAVSMLADRPERLGGPFDLVLADPPYAFDDWPRLMRLLASVVADGAVVVAESDRALGPDVASALDEVDGVILRERRYGGTVVTMISIDGQRQREGAEVRKR